MIDQLMFCALKRYGKAGTAPEIFDLACGLAAATGSANFTELTKNRRGEWQPRHVRSRSPNMSRTLTKPYKTFGNLHAHPPDV